MNKKQFVNIYYDLIEKWAEKKSKNRVGITNDEEALIGELAEFFYDNFKEDKDSKTNEEDFTPVHNFSSSDCSIMNWASVGMDEYQKNILYQNPLICGTIRINEEDFWVWVATTKADESLYCKFDKKNIMKYLQDKLREIKLAQEFHGLKEKGLIYLNGKEDILREAIEYFEDIDQNNCKHKKLFGRPKGKFPKDKIQRICCDCNKVIDEIEPKSSGVIL